MGLSGKIIKKLSALGGEACFMADEDVACYRQRNRAPPGARPAWKRRLPALWFAGASADFCRGYAAQWAPMVPFMSLIEEGSMPCLVNGVPVDSCRMWSSQRTILTLRCRTGREGARSNAAAAICNALLYQIPV